MGREIHWEGQKWPKGGDSVPKENMSDRILKLPIEIMILGHQDSSMCQLLSMQAWQCEFDSWNPCKVGRRELTLRSCLPHICHAMYAHTNHIPHHTQ